MRIKEKNWRGNSTNKREGLQSYIPIVRRILDIYRMLRVWRTRTRACAFWSDACTVQTWWRPHQQPALYPSSWAPGTAFLRSPAWPTFSSTCRQEPSPWPFSTRPPIAWSWLGDPERTSEAPPRFQCCARTHLALKWPLFPHTPHHRGNPVLHYRQDISLSSNPENASKENRPQRARRELRLKMSWEQTL